MVQAVPHALRKVGDDVHVVVHKLAPIARAVSKGRSRGLTAYTLEKLNVALFLLLVGNLTAEDDEGQVCAGKLEWANRGEVGCFFVSSKVGLILNGFRL